MTELKSSARPHSHSRPTICIYGGILSRDFDVLFTCCRLLLIPHRHFVFLFLMFFFFVSVFFFRGLHMYRDFPFPCKFLGASGPKLDLTVSISLRLFPCLPGPFTCNFLTLHFLLLFEPCFLALSSEYTVSVFCLFPVVSLQYIVTKVFSLL